MLRTFGKPILFVVAFGVLFPFATLAAVAVAPSSVADTCTKTLSAFSTMVKPLLYSDSSIKPGTRVDIPLSLTNNTKTPLDDVHLFTKVTRLNKTLDVVSLKYDSRAFTLPPGMSATTSVSWNSEKSEAAGLYRVDIFALPNANFATMAIAGSAPASATHIVEIIGDNKTSPLTIEKDNVIFTKIKYNPAHPIFYDEDELGDIRFTIRNSAAKSIDGVMEWKVYPDQRLEEKSLLLASSTALTVSANGTSVVSFPVPEQKIGRYFAIAEIIENGRHVLMPLTFYRFTKNPLPLNVFGIESTEGDGKPFDLREGRVYRAFACLAGTSKLSPTTMTLTVLDGLGKEVATQQLVSKIDEVNGAFGFTFTSPSNISDARLVLTAESVGGKIEESLAVTCGEYRKGACQPLTFLDALKSWAIPIGIGLVLIVVGVLLVLKKRNHKNIQHEEIS